MRRIFSLSQIVQPGSLIEVPGCAFYELRWSDDRVCWTSWNAPETWQKVSPGLDEGVWMQIRASESIGRILIDKIAAQFEVRFENPDSILSPCECSSLFNPYEGLECAISLEQNLTDNIICMFGIPIYYFKTDPQAESADTTFKEWGLHGVTGIKRLKLMLTDGEMPSSNPNLSEIDFGWQADWSGLEISKSQFATAFGDNAFPHNNDFIYIPLQNRMWQVNSAYDEKKEGLMWKSATWKLALSKFENRTSTAGLEDIIDKFNQKTYESVFGETERIEQHSETSYDQLREPLIAADNLTQIFETDAQRSAFDMRNIEIETLDSQHLICHNNTIVARNMYRLKKNEAQIVYQGKYSGHSGLLSLILRLPGGLRENDESSVLLQCGPIRLEIGYETLSARYLIGSTQDSLGEYLDPNQTYLIYYIWNRGTHLDELHILRHIRRTDFPRSMVPATQYYFSEYSSLSGPYCPDYSQGEQISAEIILSGLSRIEISNIKYYKQIPQNVLPEVLRYSTTSPDCVLNDLARPLNTGLGFTPH